MKGNNLTQLLKLLKNISVYNKYQEDIELIKEIYNKLENLVSGHNINIDDLEYIQDKINYLDQKYDDLYDLINLYLPEYIAMKKIVHNEHVQELRRQNRKKKEGM